MNDMCCGSGTPRSDDDAVTYARLYRRSHAAVIHFSGEARSVQKYVNDGVSQHGRHRAYWRLAESKINFSLSDPTRRLQPTQRGRHIEARQLFEGTTASGWGQCIKVGAEA